LVTGDMTRLGPGMFVIHDRSTPCGAHTSCVYKGFWRVASACGIHARDQMKRFESPRPTPTYRDENRVRMGAA
jgi:hypothetical protein